MRLLLLLAGLLLAMPAAEARMHAPYRGHRIVPAGTAPLDGFTAPVAAYGLRRLKSTYSGPALRLRRASDNAEQDIDFLGFVPGLGAPLDVAAAGAHCAATSCFVRTWYDQSGGGRHLQQAVAGSQPPFVLACNGSLPCLQLSSAGAAYGMATVANYTPAGIVTLSAVGRRTSGLGQALFVMQSTNVNRIGTGAGASQWFLSPGATVNGVADGGWHASVGTIAGVGAGFMNIDGVETAATGTASTLVGPHGISGPAGTVVHEAEVIIWDNYNMPAGERAAWVANQTNYWVPYSLDAFATPAGAYSFRKLKSTYSGPAIRIRRASDNAELDINFLGFVPGLGSPWDEASALAHCAATSCFVKTMYDQSGAGVDMTQASTAAQPPLTFNCWGGLPCFETTNNTFYIQAASRATTSPVTLSGVAERISGTGFCTYKAAAGANLLNSTGAGQWTLAGTGTVVAAAADAARHAFIGVINGASSVLRVDAAETTGTAAVITTANVWQMQGGASPTVCKFGEYVVWSGYALSAGERTVLQANQKSFWGTP